MSKNDKIVDQYFELEQKLWKLAGCKDVHYPGIEDGRHHSYYLTDNEILYGEPGTQNYYGGDIYGTAVFRGKKYTIAVYDNGCGDRKCPILLDNSKALSEWPEPTED